MAEEIPPPSAAPPDPAAAPSAPRWVRRFDGYDRSLHVLLMTSFLGLAFTGLPLLFSERAWAAKLSRIVGGFQAAGFLHRVFALCMLLTFGLHLARLLKKIFGDRDYGILWGPRSMVPRLEDLKQLIGHVRWFVGRGPRPDFDRYTYWEKFDYWAVFWGMGIIGGSGLILWFPKFWARFLPGDLFNVGLLVHGEEALLATVFIFTVHFFNGHLRPEKFPMDTVIFTGVLPLDEVRHERPAEYARLVAEGGIEEITAPPPDPEILKRGRIVGSTAVLLGLLLVTLTLYALLT
jgi:cytochrome b subunit of formate dehydrogenase